MRRKNRRKIVLMDIDGVVSPLGSVDKAAVPVDMSGWAAISIPEKTVSLLLEMQDALVWSSTWEDLSNNINKALKIPDSEFLSFSSRNENWLKEQTLLNYCKKNRSDDILIVDDEFPEKSKLYTLKNVEILVPDGVVGLSDGDRGKIKEFLKEE